MDLVSIVLILLGIVLDVLFIVIDDKYHNALSIPLKTLASLMFVLLAYRFNTDGTATIIALALTFNMIGDFILILRNIDKKHKDQILITGTLFFLVGHILLSVYLIDLNTKCLLPGLIINLITFVISFIYLVKPLKVSKAVKTVGSIYVFSIMCTSGLALALTYINPSSSNIFFLIASLVFEVSDIILIIQRFKKDMPGYLQVIYRILYYVSQMLFALYIFIK